MDDNLSLSLEHRLYCTNQIGSDMKIAFSAYIIDITVRTINNIFQSYCDMIGCIAGQYGRSCNMIWDKCDILLWLNITEV